MKKKLSFILFFIVFLGDVLYAQCTKPAKPDSLLLTLDVDHVFSIRNKGMSMHGYDFNFGLKHKRVELLARMRE